MNIGANVDKVIEVGGSVSRCSVCNRVLTDPDSVAKGIGPVCERALMAKSIRVEEGLDAFFPHFLCAECGDPTPAPMIKQGLCPQCLADRQIEAEQAKSRAREIPIVKGMFSEV